MDVSVPSTSTGVLSHDVSYKPSVSHPNSSVQKLSTSNDEIVCLSSDNSDVEIVDADEEMNVDEVVDSSDKIFDTDLNVSNLMNYVNECRDLHLLFKNHLMEPLTFLLLLHDYPLELKLIKLIEKCGGYVYDNKSKIDGYTIALVKDNSCHWSYLGPVFKVSYLQSCIDAKRILNITQFFKSSAKYKFSSNFNYMNVVYYKKYTWESIPDRFKVFQKKTDFSPTKTVVRTVSIESSDEDETFTSKAVENQQMYKVPVPIPVKISKQTRLLYSRKEDESIVKYIVKNDGYDNVKGNMLWKKMENDNICPQRTWQSMKEHFLKKIVYNLNSFKFLTEKQIKLLQVCGVR